MREQNIFPLLIIDAVLLAATFLFSEKVFMLLGAYVAASITLLLLYKRDWKLYLVTLAFALIAEPLSVAFNLWSYPAPLGISGVPFWIFLMWGVAALNAHRIGLYLSKKS